MSNKQKFKRKLWDTVKNVLEGNSSDKCPHQKETKMISNALTLYLSEAEKEQINPRRQHKERK